MRKGNYNVRQKRLSVLIVVVAFLCAFSSGTSAQESFKTGDKVMASPSMIKDEKYYKLCTVIKFDQTASAYLLNCEGAEYHVQAAYIRAAKHQPETNKADESSKEASPVIEKSKDSQNKAHEIKRGFKVGDRVLASPTMLKDDKYYQPCTITSIIPPNSYRMRCDPFNGISFEDYSVREDFVRVWNKATPAPSFECLLDQPPAVNVKVPTASAAVFKRIIYEWEAATYPKTKVGTTFETFQIGKAVKNTYASSKNALLYEGFPQNATVYPVKTRFVNCVEGNDYNFRTVVQTEYVCAKNRFNEWSCGSAGGGRTILEKQNVPKD